MVYRIGYSSTPQMPVVPTGLGLEGHGHPALTRWATIVSPCGLGSGKKQVLQLRVRPPQQTRRKGKDGRSAQDDKRKEARRNVGLKVGTTRAKSQRDFSAACKVVP